MSLVAASCLLVPEGFIPDGRLSPVIAGGASVELPPNGADPRPYRLAAGHNSKACCDYLAPETDLILRPWGSKTAPATTRP